MEKVFDAVEFFMAYEADELDREEVIQGFQALINSGVVWKLQGHYGRTAAYFIGQGFCAEKREMK